MIKLMNAKFALPLIATGVLAMGGCGFDNSKKLHDYMAKKGETQERLDSVLNATQLNSHDREAILRQSTVDSMAYRDLFNTTELVKDSNILAEFNKIAAKASLLKVQRPSNISEYESYKDHIYNTAVSDNIDINEADDLKNILNTTKIGLTEGRSEFSAKLQFLSDMYFYGKFFQKYGLTSNEEFNKKYEEVAKSLE